MQTSQVLIVLMCPSWVGAQSGKLPTPRGSNAARKRCVCSRKWPWHCNSTAFQCVHHESQAAHWHSRQYSCSGLNTHIDILKRPGQNELIASVNHPPLKPPLPYNTKSEGCQRCAAVSLSGTLLTFLGTKLWVHRLALQHDQEKHENATCATGRALLAQGSKCTLKSICA